MPVLSPEDVGIILSYRCHSACKHCLYNCSLDQQSYPQLIHTLRRRAVQDTTPAGHDSTRAGQDTTPAGQASTKKDKRRSMNKNRKRAQT